MFLKRKDILNSINIEKYKNDKNNKYKMKKAFITGISGQDGSYLAEFLLRKNYKVYGMIRRSSNVNLERINDIQEEIELIQGDLLDQNSMLEAIKTIDPDEVYNLAAQTFVPTSWNQPVLTAEFTALGVVKLLEAIRQYNKHIKFYQASSSEMFGNTNEMVQNEYTPFYPRSPYGVSKVYGHYITVNYRESYNMFAVSGILFNHESPRRGLEFVTRKISHAVARIKLGLQNKLVIGNLDSKRDWGYAGDYVKAMWMMLQNNNPEDFVIGTGETHSVQEFIEIAFNYVGLNWKDHVVQNEKFMRPAEVNYLRADPHKAKKVLGWKSETPFRILVELMVDFDLEKIKRSQNARNNNKI